jgi:CRP-like cAMP-binding protein
VGVEWRLLRGVPDDKVQRVLAGARRRRWAKGAVLFHEGDQAVTLHLIAKGRLAVRMTTRRGDVLTVELLGAGDVVGELAFLTPDARRSATVVALEASETLALDRDVFEELSAQDPSVSEVLLHLFAERIRRLDARLLEALYVPADLRILRRLDELATMYGGVIPLTQEDLAGLAGTTRATVNRVLRREVESGTVTLSRGRITVVDGEAVARRAR